MIATVAALQLVVLTQVAAPREVTPGDAGGDDAAVAQSAPAPEAAPGKESPPPGGAPRTEPPLPERPAAVIPPKPEPPRLLSLLSAEPLGGVSTSLAWAGWSSLGIAYGQGITARDDLAGFLDFDWSKTEMRLGALYRRPLGMAGVFDMAGRLSVAWYQDFGGHWVYRENHSDRGVELVPGLALSVHGAGGVFSGIAEAPITITTKYGGGLLFSPRLTAAFETFLYQDVTVGARLGLGYRAGSGDAPLREGRAEILFLVLAGYQLF